MKIALRWIALSSLGCALITGAVAQDLRMKNQPTLAAPQSRVELRGVPTLAAQTKSTTTAATPAAAPASTSIRTPSTPPTSRWAPVPAAAPVGAVADPVSTPVAAAPVVTSPAATREEASPIRMSLGTLSPTPEMWFYEQMRQDADNPELIVRRRAEQAAAERKARIASRAWYGVSLSRPRANVTPFTYYYSPSWTSNAKYPYSWTAPRVAPPVVIEARRPYVGVSGFGSW